MVLGVNVVRNLGIIKFILDIIVFLDDDDIWDMDYLEWYIVMYEKVDVVIFGYWFLEMLDKIYINLIEIIIIEIIKKGNKFCGMSGVICKILLVKKLMFDEELKNS